MKNEDLHVYTNNSLCLGLPARFYEYYPNGFDLQTFFKHLSEHLYWVAYYERYNKAPWPAELHGDNALIEYFIDQMDLDSLRMLHRERIGVGISKQKLRNHLCSKKLTDILKRKLLQNE